MKKLAELLAFLVENFGPIVAFYAGDCFGGVLLGIGAATAFTIGEWLLKWRRGQRVTSLFKLTAALTIALGIIDLLMRRSVVFQYEACLTNAMIGAYFATSVAQGKPVLLEVYEKSRNQKAPAAPGVSSYLQLLTCVWAGAFFGKATLFFWVARSYPLDRAIEIRSLVGTATVVVLLLGERAVRRPLFRRAKAWGWISAT